MSDQQKVDRWGGPGASHENRDKPRPEPTVKDRDDPDREGPHAQVSGGGGERDVHQRHAPEGKHAGQASDGESAITN